VQLSREARAVLKAVDSGNMVLSPAPYVVSYVDRFLAVGGGQYVDVIAFHNYATPPEAAAGVLSNVRYVMDKYQVKLPLWDSEGAAGGTSTPIAQAAGYLARKYLVDLSVGVPRFNWYTWGSANALAVATVNNDLSRSPTAAGTAVATLQSWLVGAIVKQVTNDDAGTWQMNIVFASGKKGLIVWNPDSAINVTFAAGFVPTQRRTIDGQTVSFSGAAVTSTSEPVLYR
jgi:polysaccharide biosynthesis protein PslG